MLRRDVSPPSSGIDLSLAQRACTKLCEPLRRAQHTEQLTTDVRFPKGQKCSWRGASTHEHRHTATLVPSSCRSRHEGSLSLVDQYYFAARFVAAVLDLSSPGVPCLNYSTAHILDTLKFILSFTATSCADGHPRPTAVVFLWLGTSTNNKLGTVC